MSNPSDQQDASDSKLSSRESSPTIIQLVADAGAAKQVPLSPSPSLGPDLEQNAGTSSSELEAALDPYQLRNGISTDQELSALRHRKKKGKAVAKFQDQQNELINSLLTPMQEHTETARLEAEDNRLPVKIAIYASMAANLGLCVLQLYAAISSGSFSLLATGIDSIFDIGSNVLLWYLHRKATRLDVNKWPVGGARLENIGNIVYGFLMGAVNLVVMVESVRDLVTHNSNSDTNTFHLPSIIAVAAALGEFDYSTLLVLRCYCSSTAFQSGRDPVKYMYYGKTTGTTYSSMDSVFSCPQEVASFVGLDPTGAVIIGVGILLTWGRTVYREFELLAGKSAPNDFLKLLTYNAMTFSEDIEKVDTVRAYHSGSQYFVEVDIVMNSNTPLWKAHDASQLLQDLIEALPNVERAFVHVDHEATHTPEHRKVVYG
ncbi:hypothetical protein HHX47_DHR7000663 [Lentinula edodes]|nr:hypothetical protein HHX47_DHR7000663 [Lentinula edodes]